MISSSNEEYLKTMYVLQKQNNNIRVTDIATKMGCTKPSVNKALHNLKANGLINYETYGTIELTTKGINLAKKVLEAYDIVYLFFKEVLNLNEEDAAREAEKVKSTLDDNTLNMLARYVHNVLDFSSLDCAYDINEERCRSCVRRKDAKSK